jgi:hypothetical protein
MTPRRRSVMLLGVALVGAADCKETGPDMTPVVVIINAPAGVVVVTAGVTANISATVANSIGDPVTGQTVTWTSTDQNVATVSSAGLVTGVHVGQTAVIAHVGTISSQPLSVVVTPGAPTKLVIRTQPANAASGAPLATQPVLELQDSLGNVATSSSMIVTAVIATGGGSISGSTALALNGVARFNALTLSGIVGDRTLTFSVPGMPSVTSSGVALGPGTPAQLVIRTPPSGTTTNTALTTQPVIEIRDGAGNLTSASTAVSASVASGTGTLVNGSTTSVKGLATFSGLTVSGNAGTFTLAFKATGVPTVVSAPFALLTGP